MINLDDDEIAKIDEEVHNELNVLFSKKMNLDGGNHDDPLDETDPPHVAPRNAPNMTLDIVPLASYLPSIYDEQYWDANDLFRLASMCGTPLCLFHVFLVFDCT